MRTAALIQSFGKATSSVASKKSERRVPSNSHSVMDAAKLSLKCQYIGKSKVITTVIAITITVVVQ